ncbi:MAG: hypothetical protein K6E91_01085 [Butyrivibrio sp.]|nr:hypothetical protein [Butyrivibrio sp.]
MEERKRSLLKRLEGFFSDDETVEEASVFTAEELNAPVDILRVLVTEYGAELTDVLAEYYFAPSEERDDVWYFTSVINIDPAVPMEGITALSLAIAKLNFYIPYGSFAISGDGGLLVFKSVTALRSDSDDEKLYKDIELAADNALFIPEQYTELLSQVADGSLLLEDFLSMLSH